MPSPKIVLVGVSPRLQGLQWQTTRKLRIGRQENLDIVLCDPSVSRRHANVSYNGTSWVVQDLANHDRHPTILNGTRLGPGEHALKALDVLQCGNLALQVTHLVEATKEPEQPQKGAAAANGAAANNASASIGAPGAGAPGGNGTVSTMTAKSLKSTRNFVKVQASTQQTWDQALEKFAFGKDNVPRQGQGMLTLLRTSHHLCHIASLDELLNSVLIDAIAALGAQRGSIILADPLSGALVLRAVIGPPNVPDQKKASYSRTLTERVFHSGESLLCRDVRADSELYMARSVRQGTMSSIICALLRTPRRRLGALQLDRGPHQEAFTENDLYLADAIAASVAVGIESAQLVEAQRDQFVQTVTSLARAVEVRDQYTGDHTRRVTDYALLLAEELRLNALERYQIQIGTPLHDIGKIGIDDAILRKPGKLTPAEYEFMKSHTVKGAAIVESIHSLTPIVPIVRHHHERWDGSGYPDQLEGDRIAITARIVAVADAFDAMTSDRPYRPALPVELAFRELTNKAGSHFDPTCIEAYLRVRHLVEARMRQRD